MDKYKFLINELPPSVNAIWKHRRGGGVFKDIRARDWEEAAGYQLKRIKQPLIGELGLHLIFSFKSPKRLAQRDLDNLPKIILDLLQEQGIVKNDNQFALIVLKKQIGTKDGILGFIFPYKQKTG